MMIRSRTWIRAATLGVFITNPWSARATLPVTGVYVPELECLDTLMNEFMTSNGISAGVLGIMKDGCVVYQRGFGWKDEAQKIEMPENALVRLASCTKPITAAAIHNLDKDHPVLDLLNRFAFDLSDEGQSSPPGILPVAPFGGLGSDLIKTITVQHCLGHQTGWLERDCDPATCSDCSTCGLIDLEECIVAEEMALGYSPPGIPNSIDWLLGQPLCYTPGSPPSCVDDAYLNEGFMVLGEIVRVVSGMDWWTITAPGR